MRSGRWVQRHAIEDPKSHGIWTRIYTFQTRYGNQRSSPRTGGNGGRGKEAPLQLGWRFAVGGWRLAVADDSKESRPRSMLRAQGSRLNFPPHLLKAQRLTLKASPPLFHQILHVHLGLQAFHVLPPGFVHVERFQGEEV